MKEIRCYRKKPVVIRAYQTDEAVVISTLEGDMKASPGDFIITGIRGEQYPCKPDIFHKTYELVDELPGCLYADQCQKEVLDGCEPCWRPEVEGTRITNADREAARIICQACERYRKEYQGPNQDYVESVIADNMQSERDLASRIADDLVRAHERIIGLEGALCKSRDLGHSDTCIFCAAKDKVSEVALRRENK